MEQKNVQAQFQMLDSYVKEFNIENTEKIDANKDVEILGTIGFRIVDIREEKKEFIGQIELINDIKVNYKDKELSKIHISMLGAFMAQKVEQYDRKSFEEMLKLHGATTLSHLIRAYIYSVTGLSGMPQITTPMINFVEFFKNAKEVTNDIDN